MTLRRCPIEGCEHVGGLWRGWAGAGGGVWVCADHHDLPLDVLREAERKAAEAESYRIQRDGLRARIAQGGRPELRARLAALEAEHEAEGGRA